jgi:Tfp pilus assembly protein PilO
MRLRWDWKLVVRAVIILVAVADVSLFLWTQRARSAAPASQQAEVERLRKQHSALGADVRAAAQIHDRLPEISRQCDRFLGQQLLPAAGGYSSIVADRGEISRASGLSTKNVSYRQADLEKRGVVEVRVTAQVEGNYSNVVSFINGIERSKHIYLLEDLSLAESAAGNAIRLNLQLRTYFRTAAPPAPPA